MPGTFLKKAAGLWAADFAIAFVLTLITYAIFNSVQPDVPLSAAETTVVYGFWFVIAALGSWLWARRRKEAKAA